VSLERELGKILGRDVDAVPAGSVKPLMADRIMAEAIPL